LAKKNNQVLLISEAQNIICIK